MILRGFPIPPSVNNYLRPLRESGRFVKTKEAQIYDDKVKSFYYHNLRNIRLIQPLFKKQQLRLDFYFVFLKSRFVGKENQIKEKDYKNHIKIAEDSLIFCLNDLRKKNNDKKNKIKRADLDFDDSYIKSGFTELIYCEDQSKEEVIFSITLQEKIRSLDELLITLS